MNSRYRMASHLSDSDANDNSNIVVHAVEYDEDDDDLQSYDEFEDDYDDNFPAVPQRTLKPVAFPKPVKPIASKQAVKPTAFEKAVKPQAVSRGKHENGLPEISDPPQKAVTSRNRIEHNGVLPDTTNFRHTIPFKKHDVVLPETTEKQSGDSVPMQIPANDMGHTGFLSRPATSSGSREVTRVDWGRIFRPAEKVTAKSQQRASDAFPKSSNYSKNININSDSQNIRGFVLPNQLSSPPSGLKMQTSYAAVQWARKKLMIRECEEHNLLPRRSVYRTRSIVDKERKFLYCPIEKAASTFMRRFMYSLTHSGVSQNIPSPFDTPILTALEYDFDNLRTLYIKGIYNFVDVSTKFLVVREPYSRLFSAYVDKLLTPNLFYWKMWAKPAISQFRKSPSAKALACGHDVTFAEFVKYVIDMLHDTDEHLRTVRSLCTPCEMDFTLIAHLETFSEDFLHLNKVLNITVTNFSFDTLSADVAIDSIVDSTNSAFEFYFDLQDCISKIEMGKRLWRQMQLKGIISDELDFPLSEADMSTMKPLHFVHVLDSASRKSGDPEKLRHQKQQALKAAFETVPAGDILRLIEIYSLDFEMFGYDKYPDFLVEK